MKNILVIHGPNLNLLGERETEIYGTASLKELNSIIRDFSVKRGMDVKIFQSNSEGAIIDFIHENRTWAEGIIINPAAYTHYSYAIRDAISSVSIPAVEVHLSSIGKREDFRRISVIAPVCISTIEGKGTDSYLEGIRVLQTIDC